MKSTIFLTTALYVIGIKNYDLGQLQSMASAPQEDYLFAISEFEQLDEIVIEFQAEVCTQNFTFYNHSVVPDYAACYTDPCYNDGVCLNSIDFLDYSA